MNEKLRVLTAQDAYAAMMRLRVAPALRELGFKGSGTTFTLPDRDYWAIVGFQGSRRNDRRQVSFTVNLTVASKAAWLIARLDNPRLRERPAANTSYFRWSWQTRIGVVLPGGREIWWAIGPGIDVQVVADEVIAAIRDHALPAMREQLQPESQARDVAD